MVSRNQSKKFKTVMKYFIGLIEMHSFLSFFSLGLQPEKKIRYVRLKRLKGIRGRDTGLKKIDIDNCFKRVWRIFLSL